MNLIPTVFWTSLQLTLCLAAVTTVILLIICIPLAHWLNKSRSLWGRFLQVICTLPVVLPPTVIGFYLLIFLSPRSPVGGLWFDVTGQTLVFSFTGLVIGSVFYSLPFALQPIQTALRAVPPDVVDAAANLGANQRRIFRDMRLPLAKRGIFAGAMLSFSHTIGEFGVVLMIGGSIEGKTRVASITLYDEVQKMNYSEAHMMALILLLLSVALLMTISRLGETSLFQWKIP